MGFDVLAVSKTEQGLHLGIDLHFVASVQVHNFLQLASNATTEVMLANAPLPKNNLPIISLRLRLRWNTKCEASVYPSMSVSPASFQKLNAQVDACTCLGLMGGWSFAQCATLTFAQTFVPGHDCRIPISPSPCEHTSSWTEALDVVVVAHHAPIDLH